MMISFNGGFTFAERPEIEAPDARIIWRSDLDPGALTVAAEPSVAGHPDAIDLVSLAPWLTIVGDEAGEHAVLSDGRHHIRIDVEQGSLAAGQPVILQFRLRGLAAAEPKLLPLRRLFDLCRHRRFSLSLYPPDRRAGRVILALRVHDAVRAGASQREIAHILYGEDRTTPSGAQRADSLRSRVRRLVADAGRLARGGYRTLMKQRP